MLTKKRSTEHHAEAEDLAHGKIEENQTRLTVRLPEVFQEKTHEPIPEEEQGQEESLGKLP